MNLAGLNLTGMQESRRSLITLRPRATYSLGEGFGLQPVQGG